MTNQDAMEKALKERDEADYQCFNLVNDYVTDHFPNGTFVAFLKKAKDHVKIRRQADEDFIKFQRAAILDDQLAAARGSY